MNNEKNLATNLISKIIEHSGFDIKIEASNILLAPQKRFDALLNIKMGKTETPYVAEIKNEIFSHDDIKKFIESVRAPLLPMIISNKMHPDIKEHLKRRGVGFLCGDGDFYIPIANVKDTKKTSIKRSGNIHNIRGMGFIKLSYALARLPETRRMNIMELSENLKMSAGNVSKQLSDWKRNGFLENVILNFNEKNLDSFIKRWASLYYNNILLHPNILIGTYKSQIDYMQKEWKNLDLAENKSWWGGEAALSQYTNYLTPESFILYSNEKIATLVSKFKLKEDPNGEFKIYRPFWGDFLIESQHQRKFVDPLIAYGDLIFSNHSRIQKSLDFLLEKMLHE